MQVISHCPAGRCTFRSKSSSSLTLKKLECFVSDYYHIEIQKNCLSARFLASFLHSQYTKPVVLGARRMTFKCVQCGTTWTKGEESTSYSHGFCRDCARVLLTPTIRKKQLREGNFDCFGKAGWYCDQVTCKYRSVCLKKPVNAQSTKCTGHTP